MDGITPGIWSERDGIRVYYARSGALGLLGLVRELIGLRPKYVYVNSLFNAAFSILPLLLHRVGAWPGSRLVVAPRGELDEGALALKAVKKRIYLLAARAFRLFDGVTWHASSELEAKNIRRAPVASGPVLIKENETLLPPVAAIPADENGEELRLVTVGRISPKKQVHLLLEALRGVSGTFVLDVVGESDDAGYMRRLSSLSCQLGGKVRWRGAQDREHVLDFFRKADYACFPTAGENFGHVIAESLANACPVVVMDVTPWTDLVRSGGGLVVPDDTVEAWRMTLQGLVDEPDMAHVRRVLAAGVYNRWRSHKDARSFVDYLVEGDCRLLEFPVESPS
jgi:glycosyltransferase involved in cell wall biosynthesis